MRNYCSIRRCFPHPVIYMDGFRVFCTDGLFSRRVLSRWLTLSPVITIGVHSKLKSRFISFNLVPPPLGVGMRLEPGFYPCTPHVSDTVSLELTRAISVSTLHLYHCYEPTPALLEIVLRAARSTLVTVTAAQGLDDLTFHLPTRVNRLKLHKLFP